MKKYKSKKDRQAWWRSLTIDEQVEWRAHWLEEKGKTPNTDEIYAELLREDNYLH